MIQWFELLKRLAGAGAAASLLIASPGLGCYRAFAQVVAAPSAAPLAPALPARLAAPGSPAPVPAPRFAAPVLSPAGRLDPLPLRKTALAPLRRAAERGARVRGLLEAAPRLRTASAAASAGHARALFDALTGVGAAARPALLADSDGPRALRRDFENFGRLVDAAAEAAGPIVRGALERRYAGNPENTSDQAVRANARLVAASMVHDWVQALKDGQFEQGGRIELTGVLLPRRAPLQIVERFGDSVKDTAITGAEGVRIMEAFRASVEGILEAEGQLQLPDGLWLAAEPAPEGYAHGRVRIWAGTPSTNPALARPAARVELAPGAAEDLQADPEPDPADADRLHELSARAAALALPVVRAALLRELREHPLSDEELARMQQGLREMAEQLRGEELGAEDRAALDAELEKLEGAELTRESLEPDEEEFERYAFETAHILTTTWLELARLTLEELRLDSLRLTAELLPVRTTDELDEIRRQSFAQLVVSEDEARGLLRALGAELAGRAAAGPVRLPNDLTLAADGEGFLVRLADAGPPAPPLKAGPDEPPARGGERGAPLPARLFAAALAGLPILLAGVPLFASGAVLAGSLVVAASLSLAALPFMGARTPRLVRGVPGAALAALGAATLLLSIWTGAGLLAAAVGAAAAVGGWGLWRFGRGADKDQFDDEKVVTAYFGALSAALAAGMAAAGTAALAASWSSVLGFLGAAAWAGTALSALTGGLGLLSLLLWLHLPGWVGEGVAAALHGVAADVSGTHRVLTSTKRDTLLHARLSRWTRAKLELSKWNFWKVGVVWAPVWLVEGLFLLLSGAAGLALGLLHAPAMFAWGAAHKLRPESRLAKGLAEYNKNVFEVGAGSKKMIYNPAVRRLVGYANSERSLVSVPAGLAVKLAQLLWLAYVLLAQLPLALVSLAPAVALSGRPYDRGQHSPGSLRPDRRDDSPVKLPTLPEGAPSRDLVPPTALAAALVALPLWFLTVPAFMNAFGVAPLFVLAGVSLAAMPLIPAKADPGWRALPGYWLAFLGAIMAFHAHVVTPGLLGFLGTNLFWMGAVTALSGAGLVNLVKKLSKRDRKGRYYDDPEDIGAFLGGLLVLTGAGIAAAGLPLGAAFVPTAFAAAGYLGSLLLLAHLPRWFWSGVKNVAAGFWWSVQRFHDVLSSWRDDEAKFYEHLREQKDYHLDGSVWKKIANGSWLSFIWVPVGLAVAAELLLSLALGAAAGLLRAPVNWLWGALYEAAPDSKPTRFVAGFARMSATALEGDKAAYDALLRRTGLLKALGDAKPMGTMERRGETRVLRRPTLKATLALVGARFLQLLWLAGTLLMTVSGTVAVLSVIGGVRNAQGEKPKPPKDEWKPDPDDPDRLY